MLHDIISDILACEKVGDKRQAIYAMLAEFQNASRNVMTPAAWRETGEKMGGAVPVRTGPAPTKP
ncbi:MAG: hypothetical protein EXR93_09365 [Gemmatimonadetes bacterium]|nr:hypothetical protein [Gemmatimonadota bacterium]